MTASVRVRPAARDDVDVIVSLIHGLADYEQLAAECHAATAPLAEHLFGQHPVCEAIVAETEVDDGARVIGFALFFTAYSTFRCAPFLYLEDLFVMPEWRGLGAGKLLLRRLAQIAVERGQVRLQWAVLDWNEPAISFYRSIGAGLLDSWRTCRIDGEALARLAASR